MKRLYRLWRWYLYGWVGLYAPDVCVDCGIATGLALPDGGRPCCANCEDVGR